MSDQIATLPELMTAVAISEPGSPDVLLPTQIPLPKPASEEVLIKVAAAGVNGPDLMQRKGLYPPPSGASEIPGLEIAGTVVALGAQPHGISVGQEVCALVTGGGYAEYCTAAARLCLPIPKNLDLAHAAALPETYFTVWNNVFERGRLTTNEILLVHGGSSGIGTTAIQLASAMNARVFITAGSDEKCQFCETIGASLSINYKTEDFVERVKQETNGIGVNLILDMVDGDYLQRNLSCLAKDGRLVQIAFQRGPKTHINLVPVMLNRLTITGSTLRPRSVNEKAQLADALLKHAWPLLETGRISPILHQTYALQDADKAHQIMESGIHMGKIVLTI